MLLSIFYVQKRGKSCPCSVSFWVTVKKGLVFLFEWISFALETFLGAVLSVSHVTRTKAEAWDRKAEAGSSLYVDGLCCRTEQEWRAELLTEEFLVYWKGLVLL